MKLTNQTISSGEDRLSALLYQPERARRPTGLIFTHGFSSAKHSMDLLAAYLAEKGYAGVSFDVVGHKLGGSGGVLHSMEQAAQNLRDVLHWARGGLSAREIVLIGHSMGGGLSMKVGAEEARRPGQGVPVGGVVCMCMGPEPATGFDGPIGKAMLAQRADYVAGPPPLQLLSELRFVSEAAAHLQGLPALFIAAKQDALVSPERVAGLAALAGPSAEARVVEGSHLGAPDNSRGAIAQWLEERFLP